MASFLTLVAWVMFLGAVGIVLGRWITNMIDRWASRREMWDEVRETLEETD